MKKIIFCLLFVAGLFGEVVYVANTPLPTSNVNPVAVNGTKLSVTNIVVVSNVNPLEIAVSNLIISSQVTNVVIVWVTNELLVTNVLKSGQSGAWYVILTNNAQTTTAITASTALAVTNSTPFKVMVTNGILFADNAVNSTNLSQFKDTTHNALKNIDIVHSEIHEGNFFRVTAFSNSVADAGIMPIAFASSNKVLHYFLNFSSTGQWNLYRYKNPLITNLGTVLTSYDQNWEYTNTSGAWFSHRPVYTNAGTLLGNPVFIPGGTGNGRIPVSYQTTYEVVLGTNVTSMVMFSNHVGANVPASVEIYLYEE